MNTRISWQVLAQTSMRWVLIFTIPLIANFVIWQVLVAPQRSSLQAMRDSQVIAGLKPKLEALTTESHQLRSQAGQTRFTSDDPSAVVQVVQRLAGRHRVIVQQLHSEGQAEKAAGHSMAGYSTVPLSLQVTGRFNQLAHWLSDVESQPGLQVESLTLAPGTEGAQVTQLTILLTGFLRNV